MTIDKTLNGSALTLALEGRLDTVTAPEFDSVVRASLEGVDALTIDMEKLEYVSSAGLRVLLSAQKLMNAKGSMKLINVNETVNEVFEITGFARILKIE